jgi:hypothetical protein
VLRDSFYEWQPTGAKTKQPYLLRIIDQQPFPSPSCRNDGPTKSAATHRVLHNHYVPAECRVRTDSRPYAGDPWIEKIK